MYEGLSETILSVSLSAPKPGVFLDTVKYVLVLATAVEVVLLAISWDAQGNQLKLIPTAYTVPTDNIIMVKVIGSQAGRIFMAGNNGNMYELDYQSTESSWAPVFGSNTTHKCQKINHSAWNWKLVHFVPPFLRSVLDISDCLVDITVDDVRSVLYTVSKRGVLSAFYLGADSKAAHPPLKREFRLFDEISNFLNSTRPPESSPSASVFRENVSGMTMVGLFVVPITESRKVHLVVLLNTGIRVYLRLVASDGTPYHPGGESTNASRIGPTSRPPDSLQILYVRNPPHPDDIRGNKSGTELQAGSVPAYLPMRALDIHTGAYAHGLLVAAMSKSAGSSGRNQAVEGDELVCIFEDLAGRRALPAPLLGSPTLTTFPGQAPSLREGVCVPRDGPDGVSLVRGKIHDIKESCLAIHSAEAEILQVCVCVAVWLCGCAA